MHTGDRRNAYQSPNRYFPRFECNNNMLKAAAEKPWFGIEQVKSWAGGR